MSGASSSTIPGQAWVFRARLTAVIDGDTLDLIVDAGFRATRAERVRLLGVNTPERKGPTRAAGDAAAAFVADWLHAPYALPADWPLLIQTSKSDVFGRYLATVWRIHDGACLTADLLAAGHAVPFDG